MVGGQAEIVPPGNAVLRKHHSRVVAEQRLQAGGKSGQSRRVQCADDEILRAERRRVVGRRNLCREGGFADTQRQAVCLHRFKMWSAHHAGNVMSGESESYRKMAADGARTENADTHGSDVLELICRGGSRLEAIVSTSLRRNATGDARR